MAQPLTRALAVPAVLLGILVAFYWKVTLTSQYDWMWSPDLANQVLPWFQEEAREWHNRSFPLWDAHLWYGQPLLAQAQPGAAYPLNWLFFLLPPNRDGHISLDVLGWYFVVIHLTAALFCYCLARDLGLMRAASIVGALIFSTAGYLGTTDWPQMVNGAVWSPLVFLFLLRTVCGRRPLASAALAGGSLGLSWLSGHHQVPMFLSAASAGVLLYITFRNGRLDWKMARAAGVFVLFAFLCSALQVLPAIEYGRLALRWVGAADPVSWRDRVPYSVHEARGLSPFSLFGIVFPGVRQGLDPFLGIVAIALAAAGVMRAWEDLRVRILFAVSIGGLAYALGGASVLQGALYAILPSLDKARSPSAAMALFSLGAAALAACGADAILALELRWPLSQLARVLIVFGAAVASVDWVVFAVHGSAFPPEQRSLLTAVIAVSLGALLLALQNRKLGAAWAGALLVFLTIFDTYQGSTQLAAMALRGDPDRDSVRLSIAGNTDIAAFLRKQPGMQRAEVAGEALPANWGEWHDVPIFGGYLAGVTSNLFGFDFTSPPSKKLWGVSYEIAKGPAGYGDEEVFAGTSGLRVYAQSGVFPRSWVVHKLERIAKSRDIDAFVNGRLEDLHDVALTLDPALSLPPCAVPAPAGSVSLIEDRGNSVALSATLSCAGMVVLSDTYFPGWRAYVDGAPAAIYEVNGAMRGVMCPAGEHSVTMRYRPASVYLGGSLTLIGIAACAALLFAGFRARQPGGGPAL